MRRSYLLLTILSLALFSISACSKCSRNAEEAAPVEMAPESAPAAEVAPAAPEAAPAAPEAAPAGN